MPFNLTLVLSVPHVHSRFSLKNGKRYPDARLSRYFLFFSQIFSLEYFCSLLVGNGNLVIFFSHVSKFIPFFLIFFLKHRVSIFITINIFLIFALTPLTYNQV